MRSRSVAEWGWERLSAQLRGIYATSQEAISPAIPPEDCIFIFLIATDVHGTVHQYDGPSFVLFWALRQEEFGLRLSLF